MAIGFGAYYFVMHKLNSPATTSLNLSTWRNVTRSKGRIYCVLATFRGYE